MRLSLILSVVQNRCFAVRTALAMSFLLAVGRAPCAGAADPAAVITNAATVHALAPEVAGQNLPVRLEGVVTHYHPQFSDGISFQDDYGGVYVSLRGLKPAVSVGDRVVIEGETGSGDYAPIVHLQRLERLGRGELPNPERVTAAALATGRYDSRWVEVRGIVRSATPAKRTKSAPAHLAMELRSDGNDLLVRVTEYGPANTNLVDAEVIVRGVASGVFSWQRQLLAPIVVVGADAHIDVVRPAAPLETLPIISIQSLFHFFAGGISATSGAVTGSAARPPGQQTAGRAGCHQRLVRRSAGGRKPCPR